LFGRRTAIGTTAQTRRIGQAMLAEPALGGLGTVVKNAGPSKLDRGWQIRGILGRIPWCGSDRSGRCRQAPLKV